MIAEVALVLTSKAQYNLPVADAAGRLAILLRLRGVKLREKRILLRALDLWTANPNLGFVDALTASFAQQSGVELATFDPDYDSIPGIIPWQPSNGMSTNNA